MKRPIYFLLLADVALIICAILWYQWSLFPVYTSGDPVSFTVVRGESVSSITTRLYTLGLIRSPIAFKVHTRLSIQETTLQAGDYQFEAGMGVRGLISAMQNGHMQAITLTIPEGFSVSDIDARLVEAGLIESGEFILRAQECDLCDYSFLPEPTDWLPRAGKVEGYLFPDTYAVVKENFSAHGFVHQLLTTFESDIAPLLPRSADRSVADTIIMASLIEREAISDEERPIIAGILWKRLDNSIGLGVDASVRYVLNKPKAALTVDDLAVDSPYNTRKYAGLPPGPIANPAS